MEEDAGQSVRFIAARQKVPAVVGLLEQARDLLKEIGVVLDPSKKVERERDLDFDLDVAPDPAGAVSHCVLEDYLEPAIDELRELMESRKARESAAAEEVA